MADKKILHFKIPIEGKNRFLVSADQLVKFLTIIKKQLGDGYVIIASPCDVSVSSDGTNFYSFNMQELTKEDLMKLIKG